MVKLGQGNPLWLQGGKTLAQVEEGLQAILHQLEDVNPPGSPALAQEPREVHERFAREMADKGLIVPVTVFKGTKQELEEFKKSHWIHNQRNIEAIKEALEVIRKIRLYRGEI